MLPLPVQNKAKIRVRTLLGHCFYRRVIIWAITVILLLCLTLFSSGVHTRHGRIMDLVDFSSRKDAQEGDSSKNEGQATLTAPSTPAEEVAIVEEEKKVEPLHWLKYKQ